ncbi:hypothetical protein N2597_07490 [Rhizobium sophoriradicis]|uniref:hypothetical protein n=1 Tax=Rhizobium sophoriradicis TaxID=1535245 RepID=UPI0016140FAB|nr:hypothetical protein N2597_07490 [Rhizobium leguminosarum bv. phaseoli]
MSERHKSPPSASQTFRPRKFERRNLSAGQRAMARAMLTKDVKKGERTNKTFANLQRLDSTEASQVSRARFVLRHDEALARSVMSGAETLNAAYEPGKADVGR